MSEEKKLWDEVRQHFNNAPERSAPPGGWEALSRRMPELPADQRKPALSWMSILFWVVIGSLLSLWASKTITTTPQLTATSFPLDEPRVVPVNNQVNLLSLPTESRSEVLSAEISPSPKAVQAINTIQSIAQIPPGTNLRQPNLEIEDVSAKQNATISQFTNQFSGHQEEEISLRTTEWVIERLPNASIPLLDHPNKSIPTPVIAAASAFRKTPAPRYNRITFGVERNDVYADTKMPTIDLSYRHPFGQGRWYWMANLSTYAVGWSEEVTSYTDGRIDLSPYELMEFSVTGYDMHQFKLFTGLGIGYDLPLAGSRLSVSPYFTAQYQLIRTGNITLTQFSNDNFTERAFTYRYLQSETAQDRLLVKLGADLQYQLTDRWAMAISAARSSRFSDTARSLWHLQVAGHLTF